jgi:hypothetical protein
MKLKYLAIIGTLFSFSCQEDLDPREKEFEVVIEQTSDMSCGLPVIRFLDREDEVKEKTQRESLVYNAFNLEESLNEVGKELIIEFEEVQEKDFRICNHYGISYPGFQF